MIKSHHFGFVFPIFRLDDFKKKYKNSIIDDIQKNYLFFNYSKKLNLWIEYIIPYSTTSTVYNFSLSKNAKKIHHYGFQVNNLELEKKKMLKSNYVLINSFKINVPCFGGKIKTNFFSDGKNLIEHLANVKR